MLEKIKAAMLAAQQEGSVAGEHGLDLQARIWLAAFQAMPTVAGPPGPPGPPGPAASGDDGDAEFAETEEAPPIAPRGGKK